MIEYQSCISTPFGCIAILTHIDCVERVDFFALKIRPGLSSNTFSKEAKKQVCAYLRNPRFQFDLLERKDLNLGMEFGLKLHKYLSGQQALTEILLEH